MPRPALPPGGHIGKGSKHSAFPKANGVHPLTGLGSHHLWVGTDLLGPSGESEMGVISGSPPAAPLAWGFLKTPLPPTHIHPSTPAPPPSPGPVLPDEPPTPCRGPQCEGCSPGHMGERLSAGGFKDGATSPVTWLKGGGGAGGLPAVPVGSSRWQHRMALEAGRWGSRAPTLRPVPCF